MSKRVGLVVLGLMLGSAGVGLLWLLVVGGM